MNDTDNTDHSNSTGPGNVTHRLVTNKSTWEIGQVAYGLYLGEYPFNGRLAAAYLINNGNDIEFRIDLDHDLWLFGKIKKHVSVVTSTKDVLFLIDGSDHAKKQSFPFPVGITKDHRPIMMQDKSKKASDTDWNSAVLMALSKEAANEDAIF